MCCGSTRFHFRPMHLAWLTIGVAPLLLIPDYKLPLDGKAGLPPLQLSRLSRPAVTVVNAVRGIYHLPYTGLS